MVRFLPAAELQKTYNIFGHFYSVEIAPHAIVHCRSVLEIIAKAKTPQKTDFISESKPNAVFIMMNPGSSRPLVAVNNHIQSQAIHCLPISLVPTKPDTTQYQVMRLMHYCQWQHVRVLNLSDLRCAKSAEFMQQFKQLEEVAKYDAHSIFSISRQNELSQKIPQSSKIPLVYAWGVSDKLEPLIERCTASTRHHKKIRGLLKEGTANKYFHPLPSLQSGQLQWVERMVGHCQE